MKSARKITKIFIKHFGLKMKKSISFRFDLCIDEIHRTITNSESIHLKKYVNPALEEINRQGLVQLQWLNYNNCLPAHTTHFPLSLHQSFLPQSQKRFYHVGFHHQSMQKKCIILINLNDFFLPIYALKKALNDLDKFKSSNISFSLLITKNEKYCPIEYVIDSMKTISDYFGYLPDILTLDFIFKSNNLSDFNFFAAGIDWLTLDSTIIHILSSKGAAPLINNQINNKSYKCCELSSFHYIEYFDLESIQEQKVNDELLFKLTNIQKRLFDKGKRHIETDIPYNFYQMIFN